MKIQKLVAIAGAVLINVAVLGWFHGWSNDVGAAAAARAAAAYPVATLPTINVHPDAAQLRELRRARQAPAASGQGGAGGRAACVVLPYYAFASTCGDDARG